MIPIEVVVLVAGTWTAPDSRKRCPPVHARAYVDREVLRFARDRFIVARIDRRSTLALATELIDSLAEHFISVPESHPWQGHVVLASVLLAWMEHMPACERLHEAVKRVDHSLAQQMPREAYFQACRWASVWLDHHEARTPQQQQQMEAVG